MSAFTVERSADVRTGHPVAALERVEFAVAVATVFFVPYNFLRLPFAYFTLADALCLVCLVLRAMSGTLPTRPFGLGAPLVMLGIATMSSAFLLSSLIHGDIGRGMIVTSQYIFTFLVLPLVVFMRSWDRTVALVKVFCLSIIVMCLHGAWLIHVDGTTDTRFISGNGRLRSFVERSNECASLIAMTAPLLLWLHRAGRIGAVPAAAGLVALIYGAMLTGSNTGLFALCAALGGFVLLTAGFWRTLAVGAVIGGGAALMLEFGRAQLPAVFQRRVLAALESGDISEAGTFADRLQMIIESVGLARDRMLLGFGADQYSEISAWGAPVHNAYLLIWTEGGFPAVIGFAMALTGIAAAAAPTLTRPESRLHGAVLICTIVPFALLINAAPHVYGRFWIVPAVLGAAIALAHPREGAPTAHPRVAGHGGPRRV